MYDMANDYDIYYLGVKIGGKVLYCHYKEKDGFFHVGKLDESGGFCCVTYAPDSIKFKSKYMP